VVTNAEFEAMPQSPADPDNEQPPAEAVVERAAALDDYLGGFAEAISTPPESSGSGLSDDRGSGEFAGLLDTMLLLRQAAAADGVVPATGPAAPPRGIGRYTILRLAGEGGFATVWEGFDTVLRRPVAVKLRRPELLLSESARRRFVREAEIAARLVHPHIVTIFEVGEDSGREFIAAEFCSGGSLAAWLEAHRGPLEPRAAAELVRALAGAVAYAHAAGVVHRDIKPGNVLLSPVTTGVEPILPASAGTGGSGLSVKLADFGLGKLEERTDLVDPLTQLTRTGTSIGTPAWMAPEQIDRSFGAIGPATDVHALGLLLHRLLTGRALREGRTDAETYRQVLLDEPVSADSMVRGVPRDLAAVAVKCLAKDPRDRYASAQALAADLDRWLAGRPTIARPLSPASRAVRWVNRRPIVASLAAIAVVASLVAVWTGRERMREAGRTAAREHDLRRQRAVAELRRGFEALRAGNVAEAVGKLAATRSLDPPLADSLAGRWLLRRMHGEREILIGKERLAAATSGGRGTPQACDLYSIALSADRDNAAVAAADGRVYLLQGLANTPAISSVQAHEEVNAVAFSPDDSLLATAGQDGRLRWWRVSDRVLELAGEAALAAGPLYAVAFSPDCRSIATGGEDRVVRLVRLAAADEPDEIFRFEAPPGKSPEIESAIFVDETQLAVSCGDLIVLLDAHSGRLVREFQRPVERNRNAVLGSLTLAPDGRQLMACGTDATAHVWDLETGKLVLSLPRHPGWVQGCSFSPDGSQLTTACRDGGVRVFESATGRLVNRLLGHTGRVWSIAWEQTGTLLTAGADGTVRRWDPKLGFDAVVLDDVAIAGGPIIDVIAGPMAAAGQGFGETGMVYAMGYGDLVWEVDTLRHEARPTGWPIAGPLWQVDVDRGRRRIAVCHRQTVPPQVFPLDSAPPEVARPTPVELPPGIDPSEALAAWTPAGELVVRTSAGGLSWYPADLRAARQITSLPGVVHGLAVAPAGPPRVAAYGDRVVIEPLPGSHSDQVPSGKPLVLPIEIETTAVAWSPDAAVIACGARTGAVQLFEAATGVTLGALAPHEQKIERILCSPDGRIIVTADRDAVRISDMSTLTTFDELRPGIEISGICLTVDGARLVLAGKASEPGPGDGARLLVMELPKEGIRTPFSAVGGGTALPGEATQGASQE
jgi:WD40 repeat protein/tRNA A-37 threonylcarbamoyl transferase component Bud32